MPVTTGKFSKINLLPKDVFETSFLGKFLRWSLTAGRVMVVLTEFVVILAFASRFWFDKKLNDLREGNNVKQTLVQSYVDTEEQMREVLARQKAVDIYLSEGLKIQQELDRLAFQLPASTTLNRISFLKDGLGIEGITGTGRTLAQTIFALKADERVSLIDIEKVEFDQKMGGIEFEIITQFDKNKK